MNRVSNIIRRLNISTDNDRADTDSLVTLVVSSPFLLSLYRISCL